MVLKTDPEGSELLDAGNAAIVSRNAEDAGRRQPAAGPGTANVAVHVADAQPMKKREPDKPRPNGDHPAEGSEEVPGGNTKDKEDADGDEKGPGVWATLRKHPVAVGVAAVVLVAGIVLGVLWYLYSRHFENTDDAFIDGRPVSVSPQVTGNIVSVPVTDNQVVHAGDLLAVIDERDYQATLHQAVAQIAQARATVANYKAQIRSQQAIVAQNEKQGLQAKAALEFSQNQNTRAQQLVKTGFGTVQTAQQGASDLLSKQAGLDAAASTTISAERQVDVLTAQVQAAEAQVDQGEAQKESAEANLSRTRLHATLDGRVTRLTAAVGVTATQGQSLMVLVPTSLWVTANFKETQLADMKVGQPVSIAIDAFGKTFQGHVDSLQAGSGTAFSLLPAENATGNYVKVVQRVPVKITFDSQPDVEIGPGMSVVPSVTVR
ncbi:HlyD family secretion protein [Lichenifustis flavocetrariae]|uniref:HlyD family secretion protein n=1 Tax=Lichenifustis flavocetrariae TaxID=2949735 RepID=A0AA41Z0H3_9HYPH|nr:HlyD family secretion protein [Lichenifustis flavocetrariae]MCW6507062.1 HlyD family secretion protein [Lichenifustis flavocetrariae]